MGKCVSVATELEPPDYSEPTLKRWESFDYKSNHVVYSNEEQTQIFANLGLGASVKSKKQSVIWHGHEKFLAFSIKLQRCLHFANPRYICFWIFENSEKLQFEQNCSME